VPGAIGAGASDDQGRKPGSNGGKMGPSQGKKEHKAKDVEGRRRGWMIKAGGGTFATKARLRVAPLIRQTRRTHGWPWACMGSGSRGENR